MLKLAMRFRLRQMRLMNPTAFAEPDDTQEA